MKRKDIPRITFAIKYMPEKYSDVPDAMQIVFETINTSPVLGIALPMTPRDWCPSNKAETRDKFLIAAYKVLYKIDSKILQGIQLITPDN